MEPTTMKRFHITGSRYYGTPRPDSDIDILVDGTRVDLQSLKRRG
jgi:predicted nucleotidyltransferase